MARTDHRPAGRGRGLIEKEFDGAVLSVGPRLKANVFLRVIRARILRRRRSLRPGPDRTGPDDIGVICLRAGWPLRKYESGA